MDEFTEFRRDAVEACATRSIEDEWVVVHAVGTGEAKVAEDV
jgi:hypothetical protein